MVNGGGLNRRETTWDLESYRRHTLYDSPFDSMNALSLSCAKNMVHARPVEFLNEGDVCEERVCGCVAHLGGEGEGRGRCTSARIPAPTWPCGTQLGTVFYYRNQSSSPHSLARLPGNSVFRHEPPPRARHYPIGRDFEAAWSNLIFDRGISALM